MGAVARYAYTHSLVSVLAGRLLSSQSLERLVGEVGESQVAILRQAGLADVATDQLADAQALEQALITTLVGEASRLIRSVTGVARELLVHWMRRFELINLKIIIRGKLSRFSPDQIRSELVDLGPLVALPVEALLHADDISELLRRLEGSHYAGMARQVRSIYEERRDLFAVEAAFDRQHFTVLAKLVNALPHEDRRVLHPLTGAVADQFNLVWMLRYRFAYQLTPPHAYFLLIPAGHHLNTRQLLELVQLDSFEQVVQRLPQPLQQMLGAVTTINEVETLLENETERIAQNILRHTVFNLARAFAFLVLREKQMHRLHVIVKGRHLRVSPELIRSTAGIDLPR